MATLQVGDTVINQQVSIAPDSAYALKVSGTVSSINTTSGTVTFTLTYQLLRINTNYTAYNLSGGSSNLSVAGQTYSPADQPYDLRTATSATIATKTWTITYPDTTSTYTFSIGWGFNGNLTSYNPYGTFSKSVTLAALEEYVPPTPSNPYVWYNNGSSWKRASYIWYNTGSRWRKVSAIWYNNGSSWKRIYMS